MSTTHPIRAYRKAKGLSVAALAERIGVQRATVHRWEGGTRRIDRGIRAKVSEITGIPEAVLEGIASSEPTPHPEVALNA